LLTATGGYRTIDAEPKQHRVNGRNAFSLVA
jgi:hypothetical protein